MRSANEPVPGKAMALASIFLCTLPALVIIFLPMLVGGIIEHLNMSAREAGYIVTSDMLGYTVGTLCSFFFIHRLDWRKLTLACIALMVVANVASALVSGYYPLLGLRFLSGLGGGILTAVTFAAMGQLRDPDAAYGWWLVFQAAFGVVGFKLFERMGVQGGFIALSVMLALGALLYRLVPQQATPTAKARPALQGSLMVKAGAGVVAILLIYMGLMVEYTYLERIGVSAGLSAEDVGNAFSAMSLAGLLGGGVAAKIGGRYGRLLPALIGTVGCVTSFYLLAVPSFTSLYFTLTCCLYFGLWSFLLPFLVGVCAHVDASGRLLSLANAAIGAGLAFGPFIAANLIGENDYRGLTVVASGFLGAGFVLLVPLLRASRKDAEPDESPRSYA